MCNYTLMTVPYGENNVGSFTGGINPTGGEDGDFVIKDKNGNIESTSFSSDVVPLTLGNLENYFVRYKRTSPVADTNVNVAHLSLRNLSETLTNTDEQGNVTRTFTNVLETDRIFSPITPNFTLGSDGFMNCNGCIIGDNGLNQTTPRGGLLVNGDIANSSVFPGADPVLTAITRPAIPAINLHVPKNVLIGPSDTSDAQGRHPHGWVTGLTPRLILNCKLGVGDPQRDLSVLAADGGTTLYSDAEINALPTPPSGQSDDTLLRYGQPGQMLVSQGYDLPPKWSNIAGVFANASISQNIFGAAPTNLNTWTSQVSQGITGTFTTPTAGWYQLNFSFQQRANGSGNVFSFCYLYILRSGTTIHTLLDDDNVSNGDSDVCRTKGGGFLVQMAANQSISFQSEANSGNYFVEGFASLVKVS